MRVSCYNHRKVYIIVKLIKLGVRRNIFLRFDLIVGACKPLNANFNFFCQ